VLYVVKHFHIIMQDFEYINQGFQHVFSPDKLSLGLVVPIQNYANSAVPDMQAHVEIVQFVEQLGFKAIWIRDIPFNVPSFGDAGQTYDPFTYLGFLTSQTSEIALGIASVALPLHHPLHVAKAAASIDQLSGGRMIMGVASGDRYDEYPAMGISYEKRGKLFRDAFQYIRQAQDSFPAYKSSHYGELSDSIDVLPKPKGQKIPMLITGYSQQSLEWNAKHGDGWMSYPKNVFQQSHTIAEWRELVSAYSQFNKPFMQPLYIVLQESDDFKPEPIPLGFRTGMNHLIEYLYHLQEIGVNHVALNLRFNTMDRRETLSRLATQLLPKFHTNTKAVQS